jgi:hypothetical protein
MDANTTNMKPFAIGFQKLAEMEMEEIRVSERLRNVGTISPARNAGYGKRMRVRKAHDAGLRASIIRACEDGLLDDVDSIARVFAEVRDDIALDPGPLKQTSQSGRHQGNAKRRGLAEQALMRATKSELRARRMI